MPRKVAIVLRGAPGSGKTTISQKLDAYYQELLRPGSGPNPVSFVSLDRHWGSGEKRFAGCCRYWDLRDSKRVLIIELGWGEPEGEIFYGASRNPGEWLSVLKSDHREVFSFVFSVNREISRERVAGRGDPNFYLAPWANYDQGGEASHPNFCRRAGQGFNEKEINTDELNPEQITRLIV